jgi:L-galactonate dehydratase
MGSLPGFSEHDVTITSFEIVDLRFPTSLDGVGSDAMHKGTNGSHPFIQLKTNRPGLVGEGIVSDDLVSLGRLSKLTPLLGLQQRSR